jgi:predicted nucleic acid-binding protein
LAGHFFDSSALVKLYHLEVGTPAVDQIVNATGNVVRVSGLTMAELTSAFAIKVRTRSISRQDADLFLQQFRRDIASGKLEIFSIAETEFARAESLVERYAFDRRLRAPPAVSRLMRFNWRWRSNCGTRGWWIILSQQMRSFVRLPDLRDSR